MKSCPTCQRTYGDEIAYCPHDASCLIAAAAGTEAQLAAGLSRRFRIVRRLGAGGMGTVFLAEQIAVGNRPVALKVLNRRLLDDPEFLLRFQNEAASTGRIHHPNVVVIHESGQADDGAPYIAMEFLEGEPLREVLKQRGALPVAECAEILLQTARGLNAAHKAGIIHRDLKPDNIFLTQGDEGEVIVKVVDFGIAKLRESATHTLTGLVLGTPMYMSCEQASGMRSDDLDVRSDVYSLGIVVYEMLAGRAPFQSDTPLGYVRKHMMDNPPPFRAVAPAVPVPAQIEAVIMRALTKDRDQRYATALEFAREFGRAASAPAPAEVLPPTGRALEPEVPEARGDYRNALAPSPAAAENPYAAHFYPPDAQVSAAVATPPSAVQLPPPRHSEPRYSTPVSTIGTSPPPAPEAPQFRTLSEPSGKLKYFVGAGLAMLIIIAAVWYFSRRAGTTEDQNGVKQPNESGRSSSPTPPDGMVYIPGGTFMMGRDHTQDPEETPAHSKTVVAFFLDKQPVTQAGYNLYCHNANIEPKYHDDSQAAWPATGVTWDEAQAYCGSVRRSGTPWGPSGRLPTEAEWEFAARGTDGRIYPWGNGFDAALVNAAEAGLGHPDSVWSHNDAASPFGVLDMAGNVWEWTADNYQPYPGHASSFVIPADAKTIRGGSYKSDKDHVTTTTRNLDHASTRSPLIGFRCAESP